MAASDCSFEQTYSIQVDGIADMHKVSQHASGESFPTPPFFSSDNFSVTTKKWFIILPIYHRQTQQDGMKNVSFFSLSQSNLLVEKTLLIEQRFASEGYSNGSLASW